MSSFLGKLIRHVRRSDSDSDIPNTGPNQGVIDCALVTVLQSTDMFDSEKSLHDAASKNDIEKLRKLLKAKVRVDSTNQLGRTPLMLAAANGHQEAVDFLLDAGAKVNVADKFGITVLHWGASTGKEDIFVKLITIGADMTAASKQGLTCLHFAAQNGHAEAVRCMLERFSYLKGPEQDQKGQTILHYAAARGDKAMVEALSAIRCNFNLRDNDGQLPFHIAAKQGHVETVQFFMEHGQQLNEKDNEGNTPLHLAAENGFSDIVSAMLNAECSPNILNSKLMTPLHLAVLSNRVDVVAILIEKGCLLDQKNEGGCSALHLAVQSNNSPIVDMLIAAGCDINSTNLRNGTPLHISCENGNVNICEKLLTAGADTRIGDKMGRTCLGMASRGELVAIVDMIIKAERCQTDQETSDQPNGHVPGKRQVTFAGRKMAQDSNTMITSIIWKLSRKKMRPDEWRLMAKHWNFTPEQIRAIEQQDSGTKIYKEQAYRVMIIWLHGIGAESNPAKGLFEALVMLGHTRTAEKIRRKINKQFVIQENTRLTLLKRFHLKSKRPKSVHLS